MNNVIQFPQPIMDATSKPDYSSKPVTLFMKVKKAVLICHLERPQPIGRAQGELLG